MSIDSVLGRSTFLMLVVLVVATMPALAFAQCTNSSGFGTATIAAGPPVTISTCVFPGEFSTLNGAANGQVLRVTTNVATDYVTIRSGSINGPVVAFSQTPVIFANTYNGTLYAHWSTNASCGTQNACRTATVQIAPTCTFSASYGSGSISLDGAEVQLSSCSFPGEFSTITGAVNGQTLRFTSSVVTDYITIHRGTYNGPVVAAGPTPLAFVNTYNGTLYAHWAANDTCGTLSACRTTKVQCFSCAMIFRNGFE